LWGAAVEDQSVGKGCDASQGAAGTVSFCWISLSFLMVFLRVYEIDTQKSGIFSQTLYIFLKQ